MTKKVAVLTPTYNRAYILSHLYESLLEQTSFDFKWYIVDDGSTDDTSNLCKSFTNEKFEIEYVYKENGGKHTALNVGIEQIKEELTIIVDSDDFLLSDAIETIIRDWAEYKSEDIAGLSYYKLNKDETIVGMPYNFCIDSYINVRVNKHITGDKAEVYRSDVLKSFSFPVFEGERFLSEAIVWNRISLSFKMAFIEKGIYVCQYLADGLSYNSRKNQLNNPLGTMEHAKSHLNKQVKFKYRIKYMILYIAAAKFAKVPVVNAMKDSNYKLLFLLCFPFGRALQSRWGKKYKI